MSDFVANPPLHPLKTPSGRIAIFSGTIDGFGHDDCPGHPTWLPPKEWLGGDAARKWPLRRISNRPKSRLHSRTMSRLVEVEKHEGTAPRVTPFDSVK